MLINFVSLILAVTVTQNAETPAQMLRNITVTHGLYNDRIVVEWEKIENASYVVMRSQLKTGEFTSVAQTSDSKFEDITAEKGVVYWYKVFPSVMTKAVDGTFITAEEYNTIPDISKSELEIKKTEINKTELNRQELNKTEANKQEINKADGGTGVKPPFSYSGYTSIENYAGVKIDALMKQKKAKLKTPSVAAEKEKQKRHLDYIKEYYMHPVKLTLFMTMGRPYFEKGELFIINDCDSFEIKKDLGQVIFYDKNYSYIVIFESKKFIKILSESNEPELNEILLRNSDLFCVPDNKTFIVDKAGATRLVNVFNAVGLSTGYLKNDSEWKSHTIMLATSRSDLKEKLQNAAKTE